MEMVKTLATEHPVVIFSKTNCCITHTPETLIRNFGANPVVHKLDQLPKGHQLERELLESGLNPSVPAVFIGGQMVGGSNEVLSLKIQGKLKQMLIDAKAIWV
ncbi:hypothetical protein LguiA_025009 [Lonicera macranthoides]